MAHNSQVSHHSVELGARGRIVLPAPVRKALDLQEGEKLILTVEGPGTLRLRTAREAVASIRGLFRDLAPGRSLVDELIAERRAEAERE